MKIAPLLLVLGAALLASAAAAHPPYGLVADRAGNFYFSDLEAVWRLAPDGRLSLFRAGDGAHVHELALAPDGAVEGDYNRYESETGTYRVGIWHRTPDRRETWVLAPTAAPPKGIGLWQDRAGNRYTAQWVSNDDRRTMLFRRAADGRISLLYGPREQAAGFREVLVSSVGAMAFPPDGSLVMADGQVLRRVPPGGAAAIFYQGPAKASLRGLFAAPDGRVLAADMGRRIVVAVSPGGKAETLYAEKAAWLPTAAILAGPRLLVLEANADSHDYVDRVRLVEVRNGRGAVVAEPGRAAAAAPPPDAPPSAGHPRAAMALAVAAIAAAAAAGYGLRRLRDRRRALS
ncbi:MAG: virginiamycin lyase [Sphingomonadales bacterium]|jgi:hypothetical protein|nr:virginiamycin lyase [Sphingomonadales bacterium]